MAFIEKRLLECVAYGTRGGPTWLTRKVPLRSGIIRRNAMRSRPTYRYNVIYRNLLPESHEPVIQAYNACMGGLHGFRLKDPADYQADAVELSSVGTGAPQVLQLRKLYTWGPQTVVRPIVKPVDGTVELTANLAPISSVTDPTTGLVTFTAPAGHVVRWSGEFDVPVMFEDDELSFSIEDRGVDGLFLTTDIGLLEDLSA